MHRVKEGLVKDGTRRGKEKEEWLDFTETHQFIAGSESRSSSFQVLVHVECSVACLDRMGCSCSNRNRS